MNPVARLATFRRAWKEFGIGCAARSWSCPSFGAFWPTFRAAHRIVKPDPVVLDIGANAGSFTLACLCRWPDPAIYCCEPVPAVAAELCRRMAPYPGVTCLQHAIAKQAGMLKFNATQISEASSFMPLDFKYVVREPGVLDTSVIDVSCITLADLVNLHVRRDIDLVKVDVQGAELEVLATMDQLRHRISYYQLEMAFYPIYRGQPLMHEIVAFMDRNGYELCDVYNSIKTAAGLAIQVDGLFRIKRAIRSSQAKRQG